MQGINLLPPGWPGQAGAPHRNSEVCIYAANRVQPQLKNGADSVG